LSTIIDQVKKKKLLTGQKLDFLEYLFQFGPCTTNELKKYVEENGIITDSIKLNQLDRHPSVLKGKGFIKVHSKRKCKVGTSNKRVDVLEVVSEIPEMNTLKLSGKSQKIFESSFNAALLAVEIYNKPRVTFRSESYISLMVNAWTKLFHSYYKLKKIDYFYPKRKDENFRRSWDLAKCIGQYRDLSPSIIANLELFIEYRNEVEHGLPDNKYLDLNLFGECQALLFNYETLVLKLYGEKHALNQSLAFSLQFSTMRNCNQEESNQKLLKAELEEVGGFLQKYRTKLTDDVFNSQEYSVKLIQIPKVSNNDRADVAMTFVKYDELSDEDKENYQHVYTLIKKQVEKVEVVNKGLYKPGKVLLEINERLSTPINQYDLQCLYLILKIKPKDEQRKLSPEKCNSKFCHYDSANDDYLYNENWVNFLEHIYMKQKIKKEDIRLARKGKKNEVLEKIRKIARNY
tara:strand:- start:1072 stop:2451 length:1380 start_codon:yes stop_codon:yes gene_type:complete